MKPIAFVIFGEAASKANSRELACFGVGDKRRTILRKSDKALTFEERALRQIPSTARRRLEGPVRVTLRMFYADRRSDLDESIVLDVLQDRYARTSAKQRILVQRGVYRNDRQVEEKHVYRGIDRNNPRVEILVEPMLAQQAALMFPPIADCALTDAERSALEVL